jgi:fructokinase
MIAVAGEALIDLVVDASGSVTGVPGGGPFNAARMIARLGGSSRFIGRLSDDAFGRRLRTSLERDGVEIAVPNPVAAPTTLAVAEVDHDGAARYRFYLEGTSAPLLRIEDILPSITSGIDALLLGGLGLAVEPIASTLLDLTSRTGDGAVLMLDPNCRPQAIPDLGVYRRRLAAFLARADVVKVSTEDLQVIDPGTPVGRAAQDLLGQGPLAVLVTDGAAPVKVYTAGTELSLPVPNVDVVDTVGAGDAFAAAFLTGWIGRGCSRADLADPQALWPATNAAIQVATFTCTGRGAHPSGLSDWRMGRSERDARWMAIKPDEPRWGINGRAADVSDSAIDSGV